MPPLLERVLLTLVAWGDRVTPKHDQVVVRTGPDFDDQGREVVRALAAAGITDVTLLVSGTTDPGPAGPVSCAVASASSFAGIRAFWRARVVVHTHGVFGSRAMSGRKRFANIWHGMPIKRLEHGSDVGRNQTTFTIATSAVHAEHLAETWDLPLDRVPITGLPRNDVLVRSRGLERPAVLRELAGRRPLVAWLPTFRAQAAGSSPGSVDGVDTGTASQFAGGSPEAANAVFARLGVQVILKPHPLAPRPERVSLSHLEIWSDADLAAAGLTLYGLLAHVDLLISDHSSVWVDFLLRQKPMVFAVSDLAEYEHSRGFTFASVPDLLPGPLVTDLAGLERELAAIVSGHDAWEARRAEALPLHHQHVDAGSADRVAALVRAELPGLVSERWPMSPG